MPSTPQDPIDAFMDCCWRFLAEDAGLLVDLQDWGFDCQAHCWRFRLPALHGFICRSPGPWQALDYRRFRQALFARAVNSELRAAGGEIVIADNQDKVDVSLYCLRALPA